MFMMQFNGRPPCLTVTGVQIVIGYSVGQIDGAGDGTSNVLAQVPLPLILPVVTAAISSARVALKASLQMSVVVHLGDKNCSAAHVCACARAIVFGVVLNHITLALLLPLYRALPYTHGPTLMILPIGCRSVASCNSIWQTYSQS